MINIRYRDILMKNTERDNYDEYYRQLETQYGKTKKKKTLKKINNREYYNIDEEYKEISELVSLKTKEINEFRDVLLYEEKIDSDDKIKYDADVQVHKELTAQFDKFNSIKDGFYKDTEIAI